jgi:hypothetical protein
VTGATGVHCCCASCPTEAASPFAFRSSRCRATRCSDRRRIAINDHAAAAVPSSSALPAGIGLIYLRPSLISNPVNEGRSRSPARSKGLAFSENLLMIEQQSPRALAAKG